MDSLVNELDIFFNPPPVFLSRYRLEEQSFPLSLSPDPTRIPGRGPSGPPPFV